MSGMPTPPVNTAAPSAAAGGAAANQAPVGDAALHELPPKLLNLTRPVVVTGTVAGETPDGLTRVRTAVGDVLMKSPTPLPADKPVTLQIPAGSPPDRAIVLAQTTANTTTTTSANSPQPSAPPVPPVQPGLGGALANAGSGNAAGANAGAVNAGGQQGPVVVLANTTQAAPLAAAGPPLTVGGVISALVLAANPKPPAPPPPPVSGQSAGSRAAPAPGEATRSAGEAEPDGRTTGAPRTGGAATSLSANTQGRAVELGGDAAHPGTFTPRPGNPAPAPQGGEGAERREGTGGQGSAPQGKAPSPPPEDEGPPTGRTGSRSDTPAPRTMTVGRMALPEMGNDGAERSRPTTGGGATATGGTAPTAPQRGAPTGGGAPITTPPEDAKPATGADILRSTRNTGAVASDAPDAAPPGPKGAPAPPPAPPDLRAGQTLALKVVSITPPDGRTNGAAPPAASALPSAEGDEGEGATIRGTVAGTTPQGRPIVATSDGMLALNTAARPPIGSLLTLRVADPATLGMASATDPAAPLPDYLTGKDWSALRDVLGTLAQLDPALAQTLIQTVLPQPNKKLTAAMTFFIAAMRGGDARGWLGADATRALLKGGKEGALRGLEREMGEKSRSAGEAAPDDWRGYPIPMYDQSGINAMALHVRPFPDPDDPDGTGKDGGKGSRFLLDVELSRLGPLQLDGMVRPPRFDLILRSAAPLTMELRQELREIFAESLEAVGFEGGLSFQSDARSWVKLARKGSAGPAVTA